MRQHVRIVAWLFIAYSALLDAIGFIVALLVAGGGALSGDRQALMITGAVGIFLLCMLVVLSIPGYIAGIGLLKFREWARILSIVLAVLHLFSFPLGTALGIYTLWVMLSAQTQLLFEPAARPV